MEKNKSDNALRFAYTLTQIAYGGYLVIGALVIAISLYQSLVGFGGNWQFGLDTPLKMNVDFSGTLTAGSTEWPVSVTEVTGEVQMISPPTQLIWLPALGAVVLVVLGFFVVRYFRQFIRLLYQKHFFDAEVPKALRKTALFLLVAWLWQTTLRFWLTWWLGHNLTLTGATLQQNYVYSFWLPGLALLFFVFAQVFEYGKQLEEEQKLTI